MPEESKIKNTKETKYKYNYLIESVLMGITASLIISNTESTSQAYQIAIMARNGLTLLNIGRAAYYTTKTLYLQAKERVHHLPYSNERGVAFTNALIATAAILPTVESINMKI